MSSRLGPFTFGIFALNISIKRYCNKKKIFCHGCLKSKVSSLQKLAQGTLGFLRVYQCLLLEPMA